MEQHAVINVIVLGEFTKTDVFPVNDFIFCVNDYDCMQRV